MHEIAAVLLYIAAVVGAAFGVLWLCIVVLPIGFALLLIACLLVLLFGLMRMAG